MIDDKESSNMQSKDTFEQTNLYALSFEQLARHENELVDLARPESNLSRNKKEAVVSMVASAIALVDICNLFHDNDNATLDTRIGIHDINVVRSRGEGGMTMPCLV